jgi:F-type H+-transporting ATPase subunit b
MAETGAAKSRATQAFEAQVKAADADLAERLGHHDLAIANAKAEAMANLQTVAADAARDLVAKLSGVHVGEDAAADAVRKVSAHG